MEHARTYLVQHLGRVVFGVVDERIRPGREPQPVGLVGEEKVGQGNGAYFCGGDHLGVLTQLNQLVVLGRQRLQRRVSVYLFYIVSSKQQITYTVPSGIHISTQDIDGVIARVPVLGDGVPDPDDVVDVVEVGDAVVEQIPELLGRLGTLGSPPEPFTLGLVEGAEQDGHTGVLEALQLLGDGVNVTQDEGVVGVRGVGEGGGHVEVGGTRVETRPPGVLLGVVYCAVLAYRYTNGEHHHDYIRPVGAFQCQRTDTMPPLSA